MESQSHSLDTEPVTHPQTQPADVPTDEELVRRYSFAIGDLVEDALKRGKHRIVIDALTWHLARFIVHFGAVAAGNVFERIGAHTTYLTEHAQAQAEAEQAKQEGRKPN
jgi:hypothetical protein